MKSDTGRRTLIIVRALPYESTGTPSVIRNLLEYLDSASFVVFGGKPNPAKIVHVRLDHKMYSIYQPYFRGARHLRWLLFIPAIFYGIYIIRKEDIRNIIGVFQDEYFLSLAFVLSKLFPKLRFYPYLMDMYAEQYPRRVKWQGKIFHRAHTILTLNIGIRRVLEQRYPALQFAVVPMIIPKDDNHRSNIQVNTASNVFTIVFSGTVNSDRIEPLKVLIKYVGKRQNIRFAYLSPTSESELRSYGVFSENCSLKYCSSKSELLTELAKADLLYIPISFNYRKEKYLQMKTVFGAKTIEYLLVDKPILVHCPGDYFTSEIFSEYGAGYILNSLDEAEVELYLNDLLSTYESTFTSVLKGSRAMSSLFAPDKVRNDLLSVLS